MRLAIVADVYPPLRSSGAVQLRDLSRELVRQGHAVTMMVASPGLDRAWQLEELSGVRVLRLRAPQTKDVGLVRRTFAEALMPFAMLGNLRRSPLADERWQGVIWYSPTIFLGPIVSRLRRASRCKSYLIVRDIFPEWALDVGLMGRGASYFFFRAVARYQYSVADVIGIQTPGNAGYFSRWIQAPARRLEVLHNWLAPAAPGFCSIVVNQTALSGRRIFVYAGNMGVAQGMEILIDLATQLRARADIGFLFVGRGSAVGDLKRLVALRALDNVAFFDEIDPDEVPGLYRQCHVGMVALDPRHRTHNIPGKFLSYMQAGLPVLASVNPENDIVGLIRDASVGRACIDASAATLASQAELLLQDLQADAEYAGRARVLADRLFAVDIAARQVAQALELRGAP